MSFLRQQETAIYLEERQRTDPTLVSKFLVDLNDEKRTSGHTKGRTVSLWTSDAVLLVLEHIQVFALIVSSSLSWPWPLDWIQGASGFLLFNLDLWELVKIHTVYEGQTHAFEDPSEVPFDYLGYAIVWLMAAVLLPVVFCLLYAAVARVPQFGPVHVLLLRARLVWWFVVIVQAFSLPFGLVVVRLFGCKDYPLPGGGEQLQSTVLSDTECGGVKHVVPMIPLLITGAFYFIVLPSWMMYKIRRETIVPTLCICRAGNTHKQFVQVKEAEYVLGLDISWATQHYAFFSSFRRPWVWFRPLTFFTKGIILMIYGALFYDPVNPTVAMFAFIGLCCIAVVFVPVYRLHSFSIMLAFSIFVNLCNILIGMLIALEVRSGLLVGDDLFNALLILNISWLLGAVIWLVYLVLRSSRKIGNKSRPLWPLLSELDRSSSLHSENTEKFCVAILCARKVLEQCYSYTRFFAPVHELARHIHIINAYCREAELLHDPMHPSLWALLAEMVDLHTELAPHTMYGTSTRESLSQTVVDLLDLVPEFRQRMDQREHDMILWSPRTRRVLLKCQAVSAFLNLLPPRARSELDSRVPSTTRRESNLSFLHDETEEYNDDYLVGVETWVNARRGAPHLPPRQPTTRTLPRKMPRNVSTDSTQSNERFVVDVERWEIARKISLEQQPSAARPGKTLSRTSRSQLSTGSLQSNDAFVEDVDRWVKDRRSSLASASQRHGQAEKAVQRPKSAIRSSSTTSDASGGKKSVHFTLGTISETEPLPSTGSSTSDVFTG